MIVLYDEDERLASKAANTMSQKGFENVHMLSGGLKRFGWDHPELLEGELPDHLAKPKTPSPTGSRRGHRGGSGGRSRKCNSNTRFN